MPTVSFQSQLSAVLRMNMKRKWRQKVATLFELGFPILMAVVVTLIIRLTTYKNMPISAIGKTVEGLHQKHLHTFITKDLVFTCFTLLLLCRRSNLL